MRSALVALTTLALLAGPTFAKDAKPKAEKCRDAKGHYTACPAGAAPATTAAPATAPAPAMKAAPAIQPTPAAKPAPASAMMTKSKAPASSGLPMTRPAGATAQCKDGSYSMSKTHSGSCSHHGGVASWL